MTTSVLSPTFSPPVGFEPREIDDSPTLLAHSYRLRYQVYCLERQFLPRDHYPSEQEIDRFDEHSVHVGAVDGDGLLAGTARLVRNGVLGLPLLHRCTVYPHEQALLDSVLVVEVSRLSASRSCRRRGSVQTASSDADVFLAVLTALYRASKRIGATHWLMAIERSLHRIIRRYGLPVRQIGPECDYFGPVTPHVIDLAELDAVIQTHSFPVLDQLPATPAPFGVDDGRVPVLAPARGSR
jgi:N-acyl amino acid synthase of PEP-CTERM/exosortase system